ncbi:MAG: hypothetical protein V1859_01090 [archaeon]
MAYYCGNCSGCGDSYKIGMPATPSYRPANGGISYGMNLQSGGSSYAAIVNSFSYDSPVTSRFNEVVSKSDGGSKTRADSHKKESYTEVRPANIEIITPQTPIIPLENIPIEEFRNNPELRIHLPRDEIEAAIANIREITQISIDEEIIIRRKVRKTVVRY